MEVQLTFLWSFTQSDPSPVTEPADLPAIRLGLGVNRPQPVPRRRRSAPRPLRLAYLPGYGAHY
jgi:hypothetical protein